MSDLDWNALLAVVMGLTLRFGIPLLLTAAAAWGLRTLDRRWQLQAEHRRPSPLGLGAAASEVRCWETSDCPAEKREGCPAYARPETPCWQVFRELNGFLPKDCLGCDVFLNAPARL
jgi:hypothetical protein